MNHEDKEIVGSAATLALIAVMMYFGLLLCNILGS